MALPPSNSYPYPGFIIPTTDTTPAKTDHDKALFKNGKTQEAVEIIEIEPEVEAYIPVRIVSDENGHDLALRFVSISQSEDQTSRAVLGIPFDRHTEIPPLMTVSRLSEQTNYDQTRTLHPPHTERTHNIPRHPRREQTLANTLNDICDSPETRPCIRRTLFLGITAIPAYILLPPQPATLATVLISCAPEMAIFLCSGETSVVNPEPTEPRARRQQVAPTSQVIRHQT